ncbi:transposase [Streptomyces sp. NPDC050600]|uniref:transposase n=1 Tax=Streptomyces sp. NPDC050600 TaxID=3157213 RepID=UPI00342C5EC5
MGEIGCGKAESEWPCRQLVDVIRYLVDNGSKRRSLPADFPPWQAVYGPFARIIARDLLWRLRLTHPQITQVWADPAYARDQLPAWTAGHFLMPLRPVLHPKGTRGFVVLWRRRRRSRSGPGAICCCKRLFRPTT